MAGLVDRAFERYAKEAMPAGDDEGEGDGDGLTMAPDAVAGKRFAKAVQSGDGRAIADAYRALKTACEDEEMPAAPVSDYESEDE